jgi:hypothetical protein
MRKKSRWLELDIGKTTPSYYLCKRGRIAQLGERRPYKPEVAGSIPVPPTIT